MPQKTFEFTRRAEATDPLSLPSTATPEEALDRVLRLPAVCSKRFLTTKVDRCVTGVNVP
jgi:phosphoribosylformylglycinamidine synthase